jgi:F0F1-type ATP synthase membrane subunit b/b'
MLFLAFAEQIQLFPDGTIFIHIALILFMIWVLNRTFFRPVNRVIESREKHRSAGGEAGSILNQAAVKDAEYQAAMLEARAEGYKIVERKHADAVAEREKKLSAAKAEVAGQMAADRSELEKQAAQARATITTEAQQIADRIAANILRT